MPLPRLRLRRLADQGDPVEAHAEVRAAPRPALAGQRVVGAPFVDDAPIAFRAQRRLHESEPRVPLRLLEVTPLEARTLEYAGREIRPALLLSGVARREKQCTLLGVTQRRYECVRSGDDLR